jgi:hypothetical protein
LAELPAQGITSLIIQLENGAKATVYHTGVEILFWKINAITDEHDGHWNNALFNLVFQVHELQW